MESTSITVSPDATAEPTGDLCWRWDQASLSLHQPLTGCRLPLGLRWFPKTRGKLHSGTQLGAVSSCKTGLPSQQRGLGGAHRVHCSCEQQRECVHVGVLGQISWETGSSGDVL